MPAADRRQQMLETAVRMVREEGVAALTLARVAQACGVTKPIAYQHFGSREGLLSELYGQLGAEHEGAALAALREGREGRLERAEVARAIGTAYLDCTLENGPLYNAISAALVVSGEDHRMVRVDFAKRYAAALEGFVRADAEVVYGFTVAFLGAGEHLAESVLGGELGRAGAIGILATLLLAAPA
ncbi:TetR/AcrR family transcriptional regulator [Paracidovorax anthurii]